MQSPNWDEFSDFFAAQDDEQACARRKAFLKQHGEWRKNESEREDYQATFIDIYGFSLDWKEGIFSLLEMLSDSLGEKGFDAVFDYDSDIETVTVSFAGDQQIFHHHSIGTDDFDTELARIESLLAQGGYTLRVYRMDGFGDTIPFLLMPSDAWTRAEKHYGPEHISGYFIRYESQPTVSEFSATVINDTPLNKQQASYAPALSAFYVWRIRVFLWCVLPVLTIFLLTVIWKVLTRTEPLPPSQPKGCENVEKIYSNLRPEGVEELKAQARKSLGCK